MLTFTGAFVAQGTEVVAYSESVTLAVAITILATAAGMVLNDYFDRDLDRINDPERPIPRGTVSPRIALIFSIVLFIVAGGLAFTLPVVATTIALVNLFLLAVYTEFFKGLPGVGNAVVAFLGGSTFLFGAVAVDQLTVPVTVLFLIAALSTLAREIIKDVEDIAGDREEGLNTLPIAIGEQRALSIAMVLLTAVVLTSPLPYVIGALGKSYLLLAAPAVSMMFYAGYRSFTDPTAGQSLLKKGTYLTAIAFIVGRITVVV